LRLFDRGITRLSVLGCVALLAATLSTAQEADSKSSAQPASKPAVSSSHASTSSHTKTSKSTHTSAHSTTGKSKKSRKSASKGRAHGQQKIDSKRTLEIQEALIREHYLDGKPTGVWNDATQQAMQKYQADNNWQSKTTPDARALIKLGLGPDHDHLLNPESAMTSQPQARPSTPGTAPEPDKQQR
jgi:Putative peptidoglycan binding domain